jgi:hypothetical protein
MLPVGTAPGMDKKARRIYQKQGFTQSLRGRSKVEGGEI